jgi:phytoene dehydrogenase-like protein
VSEERPPVVVVGAGLAGLSAARRLCEQRVPVVVLEAADRPGGRLATDIVQGFRVDRGFQVLNTGYPELARTVDLDALELRPFVPGARVRTDTGSHLVADPVRYPRALLSTLRAPVGTLPDKLRVALASAVLATRQPAARTGAGQTTLGRWQGRGLSPQFVQTFLRPFLSGVLLEDELATAGRFGDLVWRSFARGTIAVPAAGMAELPRQLAAALPEGTIRFGQTVQSVEPRAVWTADGPVAASAVVVAADPVTGAGLLDVDAPPMHGVRTWYHAAPRPPVPEAALVLDGTGRTPIVNSVVLTNAAPSYASDGRALVATSVLGTGHQLPVREPELRAHLSWLYQTDCAGWELVAEVEVPHALPAYPPGSPLRTPARLPSGVYAAGDWRDTPSIQGALVSGRRVADAVRHELETGDERGQDARPARRD